jgi:tetratricopeptide (TPR) repeat protein
MIRSNTYRIFMRLAVIFIGIILWWSVGISLSAEKDKTELRWDQQRIRDYPIYRLLLKARSTGSGISEEMQWEMAKEQGKTFVDSQRENNLKELLSKYPNTEYADDAALLLARARYFYHNDANGAIEDLYKVISKYPKGTWIAEDPLFLEHAMLSDIIKDGKSTNYGWYGRVLSPQEIEKIPEPARKSEMGTWTMVQEELTYFEHWEKYPNFTAEEARYWIAKIIIEAGLKDRYDEAIKNLQEVIKTHQADKRVETDLLESKKQNGNLILTKFPRTERNCYHLLIKTCLDKKDYKNAAVNAESYLSIYEGYPTYKEIQREAGEAYEGMQQWDKAASYYEKFLSHPGLGNQTKSKYEQKLNQIKNKIK